MLVEAPALLTTEEVPAAVTTPAEEEAGAKFVEAAAAEEYTPEIEMF